MSGDIANFLMLGDPRPFVDQLQMFQLVELGQ